MAHGKTEQGSQPFFTRKYNFIEGMNCAWFFVVGGYCHVCFCGVDVQKIAGTRKITEEFPKGNFILTNSPPGPGSGCQNEGL